jgi:DNA-binding Lrp family transcriptional regulator
MNVRYPDISEQANKIETKKILEDYYSILGPMWVSSQMEWNNGIYKPFKDYDKYLIIMFLIKKTLDFYSRSFVKLNYDKFYSEDTVEIEKINVTELSKNINIPKESARRKVLELEKEGIIKKIKKKYIVDRSAFYHVKPENTVVRMSRFLAVVYEKLTLKKKFKKNITSKSIEQIIKNNFTYIWKIYYEFQLPMMLGYKEVFIDYETFHIFGCCVVNEHMSVKKFNKNNMNRKKFLEAMIKLNNKMMGLNTMSISDITGIPRATVIRKLKKLTENKYLVIDNKKHYKTTDVFLPNLKPLQNTVLDRLADFSTKVYNLAIL